MTEDSRHANNGKMMPERDSMNHVHLLITMTNVADEHQHVIVGTTGPAINVSRSEHTHFFHGDTTHDDGHKHCFSSVTDTTSARDDYCEEEYDEENECNYQYHKHRE